MDDELLNEIHLVKNHVDSTKKLSRNAVNHYTKFFSMSLTELIEEAEAEEEQGIRWKKRKLKRRLLEYRQHLLETYTLNSTKSLYRPIVAIYKYYEIEILELPPINKKGVIIPEPVTFKDLPDKEIIRESIKITTPLMQAAIYFIDEFVMMKYFHLIDLYSFNYK